MSNFKCRKSASKNNRSGAYRLYVSTSSPALLTPLVSFLLSPTLVTTEAFATPCGTTSPVPAPRTRLGRPARKPGGVARSPVPTEPSASCCLEASYVGGVQTGHPSGEAGHFWSSVRHPEKEQRQNQVTKATWRLHPQTRVA